MYDFGNLVGAQWVAGAGGSFETRNPARPDQSVGRYAAASPAQVKQAVDAAATAQRIWRRRTAVERATAVEHFVTALLGRAEELAQSITLEQGKPLAESRAEVQKSCIEARFMIGETLRNHGAAMPSARPGIRNLVTRRPRGVIAAITPWNFPILTPMRKLVPAIAFGNAAVIKPWGSRRLPPADRRGRAVNAAGGAVAGGQWSRRYGRHWSAHRASPVSRSPAR